jgi:hypothetical protein
LVLIVIRFESEQNSLIDESNFKREYVRKKLNVGDQNISDDDLIGMLQEKGKFLVQKHKPLDSYIEQVDFDNIGGLGSVGDGKGDN